MFKVWQILTKKLLDKHGVAFIKHFEVRLLGLPSIIKMCH